MVSVVRRPEGVFWYYGELMWTLFGGPSIPSVIPANFLLLDCGI